MKFSKKIVLSALTAMTVFALVACGNSSQNQSNQSTQSQASSSVAQSSEAASSSTKNSESAAVQSVTSDLDGTYTATHEGDSLTLVISGEKGTLTKVEPDGEQEIEQVQLDPTNQTMVIGDDVNRYRIEGNQLTLEDLTQVPQDDDTIVFTKQ